MFAEDRPLPTARRTLFLNGSKLQVDSSYLYSCIIGLFYKNSRYWFLSFEIQILVFNSLTSVKYIRKSLTFWNYLNVKSLLVL